jgi:hypothetical protein
LYRFSIGDMFLIAGVLMFLMDGVYRFYTINPLKEVADFPVNAKDERTVCPGQSG